MPEIAGDGVGRGHSWSWFVRGILALLVGAGFGIAGCSRPLGSSERPPQPVPPLAELAEGADQPPYLELSFSTDPFLVQLYQPSRVVVWAESTDRSSEQRRWEREFPYPRESAGPLRVVLPDTRRDLLGVAVWGPEPSGAEGYPMYQSYYRFPIGGCSRIAVRLSPIGDAEVRVLPRRARNTGSDTSPVEYDMTDGVLLVGGPIGGTDPATLRSVRWGTVDFRPRWPLAAARRVGEDTLVDEALFYAFPPPDPAVAKLVVKRGALERTIDWSWHDRWGGEAVTSSRAFGADSINLYAYLP